MFPEDCIQSLISPDPWWVADSESTIKRGSLVWCFVPHVDQVPYCFVPVGRTIATEHHSAEVAVSPLKVGQPLKQVDLPVAAMTPFSGEVFAAYRAKKRPCLIFGVEKSTIDKALTRGKPNYQSAPTYLVAPFYGVDTGSRAGYAEEFVKRIRHCEYAQYHWDVLPLKGAESSILRLDQLQPVGAHPDSYKLSGFRLSDSALKIMDEKLSFAVWGGVKPDSILCMFRESVVESFK